MKLKWKIVLGAIIVLAVAYTLFTLYDMFWWLGKSPEWMEGYYAAGGGR